MLSKNTSVHPFSENNIKAANMAQRSDVSSVQDILSESMVSLGIGSSKCYQDKQVSSSLASLPSTKPFRSKIPIPKDPAPPPIVAPKPSLPKESLRREMSLPMPLLASSHLAKSCLDLKPPISPSGRKPGIYSRSNSSISLKAPGSRRGSVDLQGQQQSKIPVWSGSQDKINNVGKSAGPQPSLLSGKRSAFANQRRKWESCSNLEVSKNC